MRWLKAFAGYLAPIFLILSPILSYSDQAYSMYRTKSSAGFSLDIPLIMLVASMFKSGLPSAPKGRKILSNVAMSDFYRFDRIFYWPGARFDTSLLVQAFLMIFMQVIILKIALDHRPSPSSKGGEASTPFAGAHDGAWTVQRPYNFWQWRSPKPSVACPSSF
jgi:solute carrier family 66, member 2